MMKFRSVFNCLHVKMREKTKVQNQQGFTLVEIMIVLAILGAILALVSDRIGGARDKAKVREAKIQMGILTNALSSYNLDCGKYPTSLDNLAKSDPECANWGPEPYYKKKLTDPWGHPYFYERTESEFTLKSYGKDGKEGGTGYNKDISADEESSGGENSGTANN